MTEHRTLDDLDLLAYADGFLDDDPPRKALVEKHLSASPEQAARVRAYQAQTEALRQTYDGRMQEPVPDRLLDTLKFRAGPRGRHYARAAALVLLVATASVSGWLIGRSERAADWSPERFLQKSYLEYVQSLDHAQLTTEGTEPISWLSREISLVLRAPDLTDLGYVIVDKRTVTDGEHQMVRLVYVGPDNRSFSPFLRPRWDEKRREIHVETQRDVSLAYWLEGPLASAIASNLPAGEMRAIAERIRGGLLDPKVTKPTMRSAPVPPARAGQRDELATGARPADSIPIPKKPILPSLPTSETPG